MAVAFEDGATGIEYSEIWIKEGLPDHELSWCIKEEICNASGVIRDPLGERGQPLDSLFSPSPFSSTGGSSPVFERFSKRDGVVMRVVYSGASHDGFTPWKTRSTVSELVGQCQVIKNPQ